jgi:hypothetical protein
VPRMRYELGFYIPEDDILYSHSRENVRSCKTFILSSHSDPRLLSVLFMVYTEGFYAFARYHILVASSSSLDEPGHVPRLGKKRNAHRILGRNPEGKRSLRRRRCKGTFAKLFL